MHSARNSRIKPDIVGQVLGANNRAWEAGRGRIVDLSIRGGFGIAWGGVSVWLTWLI